MESIEFDEKNCGKIGEGGFSTVKRVLLIQKGATECKFYVKKIIKCKRKQNCLKNRVSGFCCIESQRYFLKEKKMNDFLKKNIPDCKFLNLAKEFSSLNCLYYEEGITLRDFLEIQIKIKDKKIIDCLFYCLLKGVEKLHDVGIIHYDLKPENIVLLVNNENRYTAVIIDFGVSGHLKEKESNLISYINKSFVVYHNRGTRGYIDKDETCKNPFKKDIYSLGIVFREILESSDYKNDSKYDIFKRMSDKNIIEKNHEFYKEDSFSLDDQRVNIAIDMRRMRMLKDAKEEIEIYSIIKEITFQNYFGNYEKILKKLSVLKTKIKIYKNLKSRDQQSFFTFKLIYGIYFICVHTELDDFQDKENTLSYKKNIKLLEYFQKQDLNDLNKLTSLNLINTLCQIDLHNINSNLRLNNKNPLNTNCNDEILKNLENRIKDCIKQKEKIVENLENEEKEERLKENFYNKYFLNLNFRKYCITCYYTLCCIKWHQLHFREVMQIISEKIVKRNLEDENIVFDLDINIMVIYFSLYYLEMKISN